MAFRAFDFDSPAGYRLSGRLEQPNGSFRGWAILAHCFTCGKDGLTAARVARALASMGIGVLRFDFAGIGISGGRFADGGFAADVGDLVAAAHAMADAGTPAALLIGHSLGGAAALAAAGDLPTVRAVATIGAPADVSHVLRQFDAATISEIEGKGEAEVLLANRPFVIRKTFIEDIRQYDLKARISALQRPLLILHAPRDKTVGIENATQIFQAARHPKSFISLDDADHLLSRRSDAEYAASMISGWAARYLPAAATDGESAHVATGVIAEETGGGRFQVEIQAGGIRFLADEPESVGGLGSGPSPYELVASGLAACTTMTLRLYAERKGWPVERIRTLVGHAKDAKDPLPDLFCRTIGLEGQLDDSQKSALLAIANRCPVDLTLERGSRVHTVLEEPMPGRPEPEAHAEAMESQVRDGMA